jgi:recombination protein RecA
MLATATLGGEVVAVVDSNDTFDPVSAQRAGADLGKLLWVQCGHRLETALQASDMILHSGGFGLILVDLCDMAPAVLDRMPVSYWYRFRRAIEHTSSLMLILSRQSVARSCATRQFGLRQQMVHWRGEAPFQTMQWLAMEAASRKPMGTSPVNLEARAEEFAEV